MNKLRHIENNKGFRIPYKRFLDSTERHILDRIEEINAIPYLLTVTFAPTRNSNKNSNRSMPPRSGRSVIKSFEDCYGYLMNSKVLLGNNYGRKGHLKPLTYAFTDYPGTKGSSRKGSQGHFEQFKVDDRVPEWNPHIHAIVVFHPDTIKNLENLGSKGLEIFFKRFCPDVATVDLQRIKVLYERGAIDKKSDKSRIITADKPLDPTREYLRPEGALPYASKALKWERDEYCRNDLYTVLPDSEFRLPDRTERLIKHLHSWNA